SPPLPSVKTCPFGNRQTLQIPRPLDSQRSSPTHPTRLLPLDPADPLPFPSSPRLQSKPHITHHHIRSERERERTLARALLTLEFCPSMAAETKPSSGTEAAAAAVQFQVDEAYEYRAPKYFDFVLDETEADIRAAERWFEAGASHAPSRTHPAPSPSPRLLSRKFTLTRSSLSTSCAQPSPRGSRSRERRSRSTHSATSRTRRTRLHLQRTKQRRRQQSTSQIRQGISMARLLVLTPCQSRRQQKRRRSHPSLSSSPCPKIWLQNVSH
uniref:TPX2 central domain-containing protein n=1 Tax=Aegilops tauschii subsp. strangulata TaxID=200361 RepID=A0A453BFB1_AEGTS